MLIFIILFLGVLIWLFYIAAKGEKRDHKSMRNTTLQPPNFRAIDKNEKGGTLSACNSCNYSCLENYALHCKKYGIAVHEPGAMFKYTCDAHEFNVEKVVPPGLF
ncbi:hypothetical protein [uncultured Gemmiger sp.]|uniref:hypothetical protein n=1 Tax=uncultured Gemmiger sp. TaxID=1623490 RepID=UPI0025DF74C3|nr:hypothetical protein [uncultured Gemmiger sp.]